MSGSRDIVLRRGLCEILQKIGKIEEIQVAGGKQLCIVVLRPVIGSG